MEQREKNENKTIACIFFDCFGVILDEVAPIWMSERFPEEKAAELLSTLIRSGDLGLIREREIFEKLGELSGEDPADVRRAWAFEPRQRRDVIDMIKSLRGRYKTVLLSNALENIVENNLGEELGEMFDDVIISNRIGMAKPDANIFEYAVKKAGVPAGRCLFTDDNPVNVAAAEKSGINGIVFRSSAQFLSELEKFRL